MFLFDFSDTQLNWLEHLVLQGHSARSSSLCFSSPHPRVELFFIHLLLRAVSVGRRHKPCALQPTNSARCVKGDVPFGLKAAAMTAFENIGSKESSWRWWGMGKKGSSTVANSVCSNGLPARPTNHRLRPLTKTF